MTETADKIIADCDIPRATVTKRYKRLQIRGIKVSIVLLLVALFSLLTLAETYLGTPHDRPAYTKEQRSARVTTVFIQAIIELLRVCPCRAGR